MKICAIDLEAGMELESGDMVESVDITEDGKVEVCFSTVDYDCGDVEYFPVIVEADEEYEVM
ncbi:hypothetical protein [Yersinia phage MHG19]|nr:hypothetical protein [Yersinia phage MHG19]